MTEYLFQKGKIYYHKNGSHPFHIIKISGNGWAHCHYIYSGKTYVNRASLIKGVIIKSLDDIWE